MTGYQPTYEELKLFNPGNYVFSRGVTSLPMRNWNAVAEKPSSASISVTSLPMRNWNILLDDHFPAPVRLPAYLWGIETQHAPNESIRLLWLPAYLWGIETRKIPTSRAPGCRLPAYLWGIETLEIAKPFLFHLFVTSLPMRNWNSSFITGMDSLFSVTSLPMRNWNWSASWGTWAALESLPAYLWGIETRL